MGKEPLIQWEILGQIDLQLCRNILYQVSYQLAKQHTVIWNGIRRMKLGTFKDGCQVAYIIDGKRDFQHGA